MIHFAASGARSLSLPVALPLSTRQTSPTRCGALAGVYVTAPANDRRPPGQRADCEHTAQDADTLTDRMDGRKGHNVDVREKIRRGCRTLYKFVATGWVFTARRPRVQAHAITLGVLGSPFPLSHRA